MAGIDLFTTSGSKLFIGQALNWAGTDWTLASFAGESFVEIKWLENLGDSGDASAEVTFDAIAQRRTLKFKGARNAGNMTIVMGLDHQDYGQSALISARDDSVNDYAFKIQFNDAGTGGVPTPSARYFTAKVMSVVENMQAANNVMKRTAVLAISSNIVRVDAVP